MSCARVVVLHPIIRIRNVLKLLSGEILAGGVLIADPAFRFRAYRVRRACCSSCNFKQSHVCWFTLFHAFTWPRWRTIKAASKPLYRPVVGSSTRTGVGQFPVRSVERMSLEQDCNDAKHACKDSSNSTTRSIVPFTPETRPPLSSPAAS